MNWLKVADWLLTKCCYERRRTGRCGCRNKTACARHVQNSARARALDEGNGTHKDMEKIMATARQRCCHDSRNGVICCHRGCEMSEEVQSFVKNEMVCRSVPAAA